MAGLQTFTETLSAVVTFVQFCIKILTPLILHLLGTDWVEVSDIECNKNLKCLNSPFSSNVWPT